MPNGNRQEAVVRQLEELVTYPRESVETEIKSWLDPTDNDDRARIAKELLAIANHGGGYLIFGFEEEGGDWVPAEPRPESLDSFNQDQINGIVHRFADPPFHCDVYLVAPQGAELVYPVVVVPSGTTVPIRACRDGPGQRHVRQNTYYIRRPGPNSEPPQSGRDWDNLLQRCLTNRREDLLGDFRLLLEGKAGNREARPEADERLNEWIDSSRDRWRQVVDDSLDEDDRRFELGWWSVGYVLEPSVAIEGLPELRDLLRTSAGRETGWPPWWVPTSPELEPYPFDGNLECWLGENRFGDPAHSDFWRASPQGQLFLVRGYQEDSNPEELDPGSYFDLVLPVWRVGECVLHTARFVEAIEAAGDEIEIVMEVTWTGLEDRQLVPWANRNRMLAGEYRSRQDTVVSRTTFLAEEVAGQLPAIVRSLSAPLYESFDLFQPPADMAAAELDRLRQRG